MNTCPACKYQEGADPEQDYKHVGDEEFVMIDQLFVIRQDLNWYSPTCRLHICPKCGCVSRQW